MEEGLEWWRMEQTSVSPVGATNTVQYNTLERTSPANYRSGITTDPSAVIELLRNKTVLYNDAKLGGVCYIPIKSAAKEFAVIIDSFDNEFELRAFLNRHCFTLNNISPSSIVALIETYDSEWGNGACNDSEAPISEVYAEFKSLSLNAVRGIVFSNAPLL